MNKLIIPLLLLAVINMAQAGCPDGSEPLKSISADGTYFVYNCGTTNSNPNAGTVEVAINPTPNGDWLNKPVFPFTLDKKMRARYNHETSYVMADFDNDGIDDIFLQGSANLRDLITGDEHGGKITVNVACDVTSGSYDNCYSPEKHRTANLFLIKDNVTYKKWNGMKQKWDTITGFQMTDASHLIVDNNPIEMKSQASGQSLVKDFNGDGVLDIFVNDTGVEIWDGGNKGRAKIPGKNDLYYLSQPDGTWLESTVTHVTGEGVKKGKGLKSYTHGVSAGDIDNDGDIDVVVTSIDWVGTNASLFCYMNQGDGHMVVRRCGAQFGWEVELGDIDNDGDLDIVFGGNSLTSKKEWADVDGMGGCHGLSSCPRAYNGILLNDGTGNFFKRGFKFPDYKSSYGHTYQSVPFISVSDLDGDGDLDVVRSLTGRLYQGTTMTIEENIGNGQFRTVFRDEWCKGPKTKADWPKWEGGGDGCHAQTYKFGDFNEDGFVDIVIDGNFMLKEKESIRNNQEHPIEDGTVYLSTGKFTYDIINPDDANYPLADIGVNPKKLNHITTTTSDSSQQEVEDELAAFEAELAAQTK